MAQTSEPASASSVRWTERSAPSDTALCSARCGRVGPHRHGHDLLDLDRAALLDLHRGLDRVRVEGIQVLLAAAVEAHGAGVHALLDGGVRDFLYEDTDLQTGFQLPRRRLGDGGAPRAGRILLTDWSIESISGHLEPVHSGFTAPRTKSMISCVEAPGVKISETPSFFSSGMSSRGDRAARDHDHVAHLAAPSSARRRAGPASCARRRGSRARPRRRPPGSRSRRSARASGAGPV